MERTIDIHKAGGILLQDGCFLVARSKGKDVFVAPGGKLEPGESAADALIRELREEFEVTVTKEDFQEFGTFYAEAAGQEHKYLQMDVFVVSTWDGIITPASEIEEIQWITSEVPPGMKVGSIFEHEVLPRLKEKGLIH